MSKAPVEETPKKVVVVEELPTVEEITDPELVEGEKPNYLFIIIQTALLVGALVGGLITYFSGLSRLVETDQTPVPTVVAEISPTPEAKPEVKRDEIKLQVLNGSGTAGLAGKAKTYLEELGYKDVIAGNASSSDFAETEIQIKDSQKSFLETLTTDLSKNYVISEKIATLSASSKYDAVITLGKK